MKIKISAIICLLFLLLHSCKGKTQKMDSVQITANDSLNSVAAMAEDIELHGEDNISQEAEMTYPEKGNKATDFLPTLGTYRIQYETNGDLNKDGRDDIVVVLVHKTAKTFKRPMLVLLQNNDKSYRLDKISTVVFPVEYNDFDFKIFDTEDIAIENGGLNINLYGKGPSGTIFGTFKYIETDFVLTYVEAYYRGAGGSTGLIYDLLKEELTTNETNTMDENMPTVTTTNKIKAEKNIFENTALSTFFNEE